MGLPFDNCQKVLGQLSKDLRIIIKKPFDNCRKALGQLSEGLLIIIKRQLDDKAPKKHLYISRCRSGSLHIWPARL